ncbi:MAG: glutamate 5-kinase [Clostridia bacterium]|nr:glutamate 5-kinase [Clostridia bacterium]
MRLVVKVGTSTLTHSTGKANFKFIDGLCRTLSDLKNMGNEVILVSSGAIARGMDKLAFEKKPTDIPTKQAAAAVGQCELMYTYDRFFSDYGQTVAQILITADDVSDDARRTNFHNTLIRLLELGIIPVINENDTIATKEISLGDNDSLAAIVAVSVGADMLVVLTDIDGLYTGNPRTDADAKLIPVVNKITPEMLVAAGGAGTFGTGGMSTKLQAAKMCMENGIDMVIASGSSPDVIYKTVNGEAVGTKFVGRDSGEKL